jgi:hypothetical protein
MVAPNFPYVAIRVIMSGDYTRAYNPGDLVPAEAVEGTDAWLKLGADVKKRDDGKSKP